MFSKFRIFSAVLCAILTVFAISKIVNYYSPEILDKRTEIMSLKNQSSLSIEDYSSMIDDVALEKDTVSEKIEIQKQQIEEYEADMAFLTKEEILLKVSDAIKDTGASFDNFYVTHEDNIKNDYSFQIEGNLYQINSFIENLFVGTKGISVGEFSIRQKDDAEYLLRFFDNSNALVWYDGSIYDEENGKYLTAEEKATLERLREELLSLRYENAEVVSSSEDGDILEQIDILSQKLDLDLPATEDITYVMTLTFRV